MTPPARRKYFPCKEKAGNTTIRYKKNVVVRASDDADHLVVLE
jgi:hypothetical protein